MDWMTMRRAAGIVLIAMAMAGNAPARSEDATGHADLTGQWTEPTGSVIRVDRCGGRICLWIVSIGPKAPSKFDI